MDVIEFLLSFLRTMILCRLPAWSNFSSLPFKFYLSFRWKYAHVQPVTKKGDRSNPSNWRPIALLSSLSKAFETILNP